MIAGFADIHHHLAYGVDDGPKDRQDMFRMLEQAKAEGIRTLFATPHVTPGVYPFHIDKYRSALEEARIYCEYQGIDMTIYEGCEILYTAQTPQYLLDERLPTLGGTDFILVEFSPDISYDRLWDAVDRVSSTGYRPIIAHAERYGCLVRHPQRLAELKSMMTVYIQINCASICQKRSVWERRFVRWALKNQMVDALATDAHNISSRPVNMKQAFQVLEEQYGEAYAYELTTARFILED